MKLGNKLALLASTSILLGATPSVAQESSLPDFPQPILQMCTGGGYPITVCEIVNGRRVCRRECP